MIGKVIKGTYRILEELGRGTVSTAYVARDTAHERMVTLKIIHPDLSREGQFTSRFVQEGRLLTELDSPYAVRILDFGTDEGLDYVVMEYIEGKALSIILKQVGIFGVGRALEITYQVVRGLEDAHDRGIVHRDVRPTNIMIAADGVARVMDFGMAAGADLNRLSSSGVVGTPHYLAPELAEAGREVDIRADIYSLGVTLFEMLTGQRPYEADNAVDIVKKHLQEPVPSMRQFDEEIPEEVDNLVQKCLAKEPQDRFQTLSELLQAVDEALEEEGGSRLGLEGLLTGQTLGQYRLSEQIGRGGMATVYKAYQPSLDRYVAVKVLPPHLAHTPDFITRFRREARAIARLNHPNILSVYDSGQEGGLSYIVMRYVEGGTLKGTLGKPLPLDRVVEMITQVGGALDYAHREGIIHRDVKPSNVLMDKGEWALLADFGLAKMVEASVQLTKTGAGLGTPAYMAPELGKGEPADERSDIYSLGIMLYEMLTGRVPFEAETPMAVVIEHISTPLPVPRSINPDIPEPVEQVLLKALAKDPADRFLRIGGMVTALQKAAAGECGVTTVTLVAEERPPRAGAIAEEVERIGVSPIEKEKALEVKGIPLKALWLRGALIVVLILILAAVGLVAVNRLGREPGPQPLAVHLTPVPTAPGPLDVVLGFGNIWHGRSDVQNHLGQPVTHQQGIPYAHQFFVTGGYLFERLDTHQIYVLYPTNEWEVYEDDWQEEEDVDDLTPPAESYAPTKGLGKLWRQSPAVRSGLEWGSLSRTTDVDGAVQQFERGLMLFNGLESKQIYILYITSDNHYRWLMLPDSWRPPPGILFVSDRDGDEEVWVMGSDGSEQIPLTVNTWLDGSPAWSCGGSRIAYAFSAEPESKEDIMVMKSDTSEKTNLTANPTARDTDPAWSPDDSRIAFVSYRDGNAEIYVTKMDGSDPINLTNNPADDWDPAWSPDGSMIAFTSDRDGNSEIYVMNSSDGQNLRRLTENETIDEQPAWWQDATSDRIAFVSYRDGNAEIYLMDSDGSHPVNLTDNLAEDKHPTWSPDGSQIAFTSNRDGDREIFVMGADGSHPTNLTDNPVDDWDPHWGR